MPVPVDPIIDYLQRQGVVLSSVEKDDDHEKAKTTWLDAVQSWREKQSS